MIVTMRIVLVGGGTGGHFYPLIAVSEALRDRDQALSKQTELIYFGPDEYNRDALARLNIKFEYCPAGKKRRYFSPLNFTDTFKTFFGFFVAIWKLYKLYPDVIFSKGGFTSVPVVTAAWILKIPIVIHESDAIPGRANKLASKMARYIAISYDDTIDHFPNNKTALTGFPIRKTFLAQLPNPHEQLGIPKDKPVIFVTGGSLGSLRINNLILDSLDELLPEYTVIHQVGESHYEEVSKTASSLITDLSLLARYFVFSHMNAIQFSAAQQASVLIISRAGSGTIAEISVLGKPSILIPIPEKVSHDQRTNAYAYARSGAATVIEEGNLTDGMLMTEIHKILDNKEQYETMSKAAQAFTHTDAAYTLADTLLNIGEEHS